MKCFTHPAVDAAGVCAQCGKFGCHQCLTDIVGALLCTSCRGLAERAYAAEQADLASAAKRSLTMSWIVTVVLSLVLVPAALAQGAGGIILAPLAVYAAWSFYWGIGPVWRGFSRALAGWGCFGTWLFLLIIAVVLCEAIVVCAVAYGALGGGIARYREAKALAAGA